ncbi:MAG: DUF432 domain-containing protein [Methanohalobium sp.]|uniref:DUF432 domain-containing protein n=1 Tax=Methanohalobium sp. TaxID=2837493 RepID=UPI00397A3737
MYGSYNSPFKLEYAEFTLSVENYDGFYLYKRELLGLEDNVEKIINKQIYSLLINPIEPVNLPKKLTPLLLIEFAKSIIIGPYSIKKVYIKYPVEIGVFISDDINNYDILDFFILARKKYTVYGNPSNGSLCRYWSSDVYLSLPETNPLYEGILELNITNTTGRWVEVTQTVLNAYGMKIYHNNIIVSMKASMRVTSQNMAETEFINQPIQEGMVKATELYTISKVQFVSGTKYVMENGI